MVSRILVAVFIGFMVSTACMPFFPAVGFAAARFTCDGDFSTDPALRKNIKFYCTDPKTGAKTQVNPFKVVAISTVVYSALLFPLFWWLGLGLSRVRRQMDAARKAVLAAAVPARATVVAVAETGSWSKKAGRATRDVRLKLTLDIDHPTRGRYQAEMIWMVGELNFSRIQPGQMLPVKVNAEFPHRVYPDVDWAEFTDWKIVKDEQGGAAGGQS